MFALYIQWQTLHKRLMKLPQITQYINESVNKNSWQKALTLLSSKQIEKLEQFLVQYEEGLDVGLPDDIPTSHSKSNPKMSLRDECKMAETILNGIKKDTLWVLIHETTQSQINVEEIRSFAFPNQTDQCDL